MREKMREIAIEQVEKQEIMVSIIIATYRRERSLYNAINSLVMQTYKNIEILVIDDNANKVWNEKVTEIIKDISENSKFNIVHIINGQNLGSATTRNVGIERARGKYITFLDDDDIYLPQKIEKQLHDMVSVGADYGLTDLCLYNERGDLIDKRIRFYIKTTEVEQLMRYHLLYHMTGTDTLMFKTEYLRAIGGFPGIDVGDEFYLMKEAILGNGICVYSEHCYVKAYIHIGENGGLSSGQRKIDGENVLHQEKMKYFKYLSKDDIKYVNVRHYVVKAYAEIRMGKVFSSIRDCICAFIISPVKFLKMFIEHR